MLRRGSSDGLLSMTFGVWAQRYTSGLRDLSETACLFRPEEAGDVSSRRPRSRGQGGWPAVTTLPAAVEFLVLVGAGFLASILNVIAGGGSFLTLPLLIFFGLPATEANATNRLGVLAQNIGGVWGFHRHGALDWRLALRASLPALVGLTNNWSSQISATTLPSR